ncbi:hypothetical protein A245_01086, partial [Pseudomonas syringae pv. actinidiae ICMP 19096]
MHQNAVVGVQRHDVGDAAQRHQIEQFAQIGLGTLIEPAGIAQACSQGHQHVKDHPHARQRFTGKGTPWLIGVDDGVRRRKLVTGQ